jgi:hypothetical protein
MLEKIGVQLEQGCDGGSKEKARTACASPTISHRRVLVEPLGFSGHQSWFGIALSGHLTPWPRSVTCLASSTSTSRMTSQSGNPSFYKAPGPIPWIDTCLGRPAEIPKLMYGQLARHSS